MTEGIKDRSSCKKKLTDSEAEVAADVYSQDYFLSSTSLYSEKKNRQVFMF
jgi:hypothetical protein